MKFCLLLICLMMLCCVSAELVLYAPEPGKSTEPLHNKEKRPHHEHKGHEQHPHHENEEHHPHHEHHEHQEHRPHHEHQEHRPHHHDKKHLLRAHPLSIQVEPPEPLLSREKNKKNEHPHPHVHRHSHFRPHPSRRYPSHPMSQCLKDVKNICANKRGGNIGELWQCLMDNVEKVTNNSCQSWLKGVSSCNRAAVSLCGENLKRYEVRNCLRKTDADKVSEECRNSAFYNRVILARKERRHLTR